MSSRIQSWILVMVCVTVFAARAHTAWTRGVVKYDEAYYLLEAKALQEGLRTMPHFLRGQVSMGQLKTTLRQEGAIFPPGTAKPTYTLLLTLFGMLPLEPTAAGNLLSLLATALTALTLYRCALQLGSTSVASVGASSLFFLSPIIG